MSITFPRLGNISPGVSYSSLEHSSHGEGEAAGAARGALSLPQRQLRHSAGAQREGCPDPLRAVMLLVGLKRCAILGSKGLQSLLA